MNIDEAIEILMLDKSLEFEGSANNLEDALQLGIEALTVIRDTRKYGTEPEWCSLPSEGD
mgnify:CR=1 FL=1